MTSLLAHAIFPMNQKINPGKMRFWPNYIENKAVMIAFQDSQVVLTKADKSGRKDGFDLKYD